MKKSATKITLADIAREANVGIATVDRVLNKRAAVKESTALSVLEAARRLGFTLEQPHYRLAAGKAPVTVRMGFILLQETHSFYLPLAQALMREAAPWLTAGQVPVILHFAIDAVEAMAQAIHRLSDEVDVLGLVALDHPLIRHAVARAAARGVRVFTLLSDLSVPQRSGYIGLDNQKAGRTAAWFIERLCRGNGEIGIIIGDNRFTCQESCEISFRSCLREQGMGQQILEPVRSHERADIARSVTEQMLSQYPALQAIYAPCGGVEGIVEALRDSGRQQAITLVCHGPLNDSELALIDGTIDIMLNHRLEAFAAATLRTITNAVSRSPSEVISLPQPFDIITKENM
ncbi:TPA: LacI family DNA-binding transcriptional regulator [Klebsiella variicola]|nr:LacI family DNA-binding transcriptional regulator [Klebsiella variicola]